MNTFFAGCHHFDHKNIIEYDNRPFANIDEMNEKLIANHNSRVSNRDTIIFLGDVCLSSRIEYFIKRLNGDKHLILGNHDKLNGFQKSMFSSVNSFKEVKINGQRITLCHYPLRSWNCRMYGSWSLHSHVHGKMNPYPNSLDVGVMTNNYFPYSFEDVLKKIEYNAKHYGFDKKELL